MKKIPKTYLITPERRLKIEALNHEDTGHYHHLAEIWRKRRALATWFHGEKKKLGLQGLGDSQLCSEASIRPEVESLLTERDTRIVSTVLDIAKLKSQKKREKVIQASHAVRKEHSPSDIETHGFIREFKQILPSLALSPKEKSKIKNAFSDWFSAKGLFEQKLTLAGGGGSFL